MFLKKLFGSLLGLSAEEETKTETAVPASAPAPVEVDAKPSDLQGFVEYVVKSLVDFPDEVQIMPEETEDSVALRIRCRKEDSGKIIGKHGKTIMALRSLVRGAAGRQHKRVSVDVLD